MHIKGLRRTTITEKKEKKKIIRPQHVCTCSACSTFLYLMCTRTRHSRHEPPTGRGLPPGYITSSFNFTFVDDFFKQNPPRLSMKEFLFVLST